MNEINEIHGYNTGCWYTEHGQRIAWTILSTGNVAMIDIDRHIDYILIVNGQPSDRSVQNAYLSNHTAPWNPAEYKEALSLQKKLQDYAMLKVGSNSAEHAKLVEQAKHS